MQSLSSFVKPILFLPGCNSDSWRRYTLKCLCWGKGGRVSSAYRSKWGLLWGLLCGTSGRRKLCMVPCCSCHIYGIWRRKKVEKTLKSSSHRLGWQCKPQGGTIFMGKRGSHYVILLYWNFIVSLTGYCKLFYRILPLFLILLLFYLFCIYWDWQGQKCHLKWPKKFMRLTLIYSVW